MEQTTEICGFKVKYDGESESAKHALAFFNEIGESGTKAFFEDAHRDLINHTVHFKVKDHSGMNKDYHLTLKDEGDNTYHLRKTTGY